MNALLPTLHSALLLLFLVALPTYAVNRIVDARSPVDVPADATQGVMQAGLPLDRDGDAPAFDIEAVPTPDQMASETLSSDDVAFEVLADFEVVVTDVPA